MYMQRLGVTFVYFVCSQNLKTIAIPFMDTVN